MELQLIVSLLLKRMSQSQLAALVPCAPSLISMLNAGERGRQTTFAIESRLRELYAAHYPAPGAGQLAGSEGAQP